MAQQVSGIQPDFIAPELISGDASTQGMLRIKGDWTIETLKQADALVTRAIRAANKPSHIDLSELSQLDTSGAWVIVRLVRAFDLDIQSVSALRPDHSTLFDAVWETNRAQPEPEKSPSPFLAAAEKTGRDVVEVYSDVKILTHLIGGVVSGLFQCLFDPRKLRITAIVHHMEQTGLKAIPIVFIMSFLVGAIVAQQGHSSCANSVQNPS